MSKDDNFKGGINNKLTCEKKHILYPDYGHEGIKTAMDKVFMFLEGEINSISLKR